MSAGSRRSSCSCSGAGYPKTSVRRTSAVYCRARPPQGPAGAQATDRGVVVREPDSDHRRARVHVQTDPPDTSGIAALPSIAAPRRGRHPRREQHPRTQRGGRRPSSPQWRPDLHSVCLFRSCGSRRRERVSDRPRRARFRVKRGARRDRRCMSYDRSTPTYPWTSRSSASRARSSWASVLVLVQLGRLVRAERGARVLGAAAARAFAGWRPSLQALGVSGLALRHESRRLG